MCYTIEVTLLRQGPYNFSNFSDTPSNCTEHPEKVWELARVPRLDGRRGRPESGEAGGALDRGIGGRGPVAHLGLVRAQSWGRGCPSDGARRWPTAPPAAARGSGEGVHGWAMCDPGRCYGS
jgi:hypothetical protein